jgi:hypothetical protein
MSKKPTDKEVADAAGDWWEHFVTPEKGFEGGWKQRNDMVDSRMRKLRDLLRARHGGSRQKRPGAGA